MTANDASNNVASNFEELARQCHNSESAWKELADTVCETKRPDLAYLTLDHNRQEYYYFWFQQKELERLYQVIIEAADPEWACLTLVSPPSPLPTDKPLLDILVASNRPDLAWKVLNERHLPTGREYEERLINIILEGDSPECVMRLILSTYHPSPKMSGSPEAWFQVEDLPKKSLKKGIRTIIKSKDLKLAYSIKEAVFGFTSIPWLLRWQLRRLARKYLASL